MRYANAVFRRGCCGLSASLSTVTLKRKHGTVQVWPNNVSLRAKTLTEIMLKKTWDSVSLRKETLKNRKEARF
jgi:hypothetical protein